MNKSGLVIRLAVVIIFTAVIVGLITTQLFYRFTFLNEQALGEQSINQLFNTVSPTASIASYLGDEELAKEVVNGLISNDVITAAAIKTDVLMVQSDNYQKSANILEFTLFSPFQKKRKVGVLFVKINKKFLANKADNISATNAFVVAIEALIITIISILVTYYVITRPILSIGRALHLISPGTHQRIDKPVSHQKSEIGLLVDDVNSLLAKAEQQMLREKSLRSEVQVLESRFRMLFENATSAIVLVEPQGDILLYNETFERLVEKLELSLKKNYGNYLQDLFIMKKDLHEQVQIAFSNNESAVVELELISYQDEKIWVQVVVTQLITDDFQENYQITLHDISKRKQQISLLDKRANYDSLTNLLNRQAAEQHLKKLTLTSVSFALIMMDLNDFKPINDIFGHDAGDELLIHVSSQMMKSLRKADVLSRWGGDEFVVILPNATKQEVKNVCEKLAAQLSKPLHLSQHNKSIFVTASMGASFYPDDQVELLELIRSADKAMYQVKKNKSANEALYLEFCSDITHEKKDSKL
ncbi:sensor domain-containing diguanylate cyclase [Colwellia psychrerythraea]|uniref:Diguanylate cyclase with PAS/PAC sensor n=1 Tax=Colwellia psychrerythraea TaxID=28229 RepID=A0A099L5A1_COLPS|nr:sensor domain-containing diguanylate cyclase [Colwellia psychrerythraea]KGJ97595.1 diguanylate cyclase with PAS/PAC sensor [Colwellia psychrerythraea]